MRVAKSIAIGIAATFGLVALAMIAGLCNLHGLAKVLFWQNTLMHVFIPEPSIYGGGLPAYRGMPLTYIAIWASFPIGIVIYSAGAYVWLKMRALEA